MSTQAACHHSTQAACHHLPQLSGIVAKLSVSMLCHTDVIPADRAFYEAGNYCKVSSTIKEKENLLTVYLYMYMYCRLLVMKERPLVYDNKSVIIKSPFTH